MKRLLFLIVASLVTALLYAGPVSQQKALQQAEQFVAARSTATATKGIKLVRKTSWHNTSTQVNNVLSANTADSLTIARDAFYVFNIGSADGFVIVSADDRTPAILGYSDSGSFIPDSLPENFCKWLDGYAEQLASLPLTSDSSESNVQHLRQRRTPVVHRSIAPLLTTTWNQNAPYNRLVLDTTQYRDVCYTGCVATAMAQLLYYHAQRTGCPKATTATMPAYITNNLRYRINAVEQGTAIDWANIQNSYSSTVALRTEQQRIQADAVANLMHLCGASVRMNYGKVASGADSKMVPEALKTYFGYDQGTRIASRYDYSLSQWNDLIYTELMEKRPVYITGASSGGGHAFIIDGYDGDEMFHFNWGWGGHCNGYYILSLSNPTDKKGIGAGNSDDGYTMRQGALIGAQPATTIPIVIPDPQQSTLERNVNLQLLDLTYEGTPTAKRQLKVKAVIKNNGDEFYGNIHFFTKRVGLILTDTCSVGVTLLKNQTQTVEFNFTPPEAKDYVVRVFTDIQFLGDLYSDTITVVEAKPTSNDVDLVIDMQLSKLDATQKFIVGNRVHMKTIISNNTSVDYEGILVPILLVPGGMSYQLEKRIVEAYSTIIIEEDYDVSVSGRYIPVCITDIPDRRMIYQPDAFYYFVKPSMTIYHTDGSSYVIEASKDMIIPSDAVSVDLVGNEITKKVTPSSNPNCVYFLSSEIPTPAGLTTNVVKGTRARILRLSDDGLPFMPMADFTADSVIYTRTFDSGMTEAYGAQGLYSVPSWTTICLPFSVDRCLFADGTEACWMKQKDSSGYNFWLMEFIGDEHDCLFFSHAEELQAYTPYLINVPGSGLSDYRDMTLSPIYFCGRNATVRAVASSVITSTKYKFVGTMVSVSEENTAYTIDPEGKMCRRSFASTQPFRAYVKAVNTTALADVVPLSIPSFSEGNTEMRGDVNGDGAVNVADISAVIGVMAGIGSGFNGERADINADGTVNVADISAIIILMAGK